MNKEKLIAHAVEAIVNAIDKNGQSNCAKCEYFDNCSYELGACWLDTLLKYEKVRQKEEENCD